MKTTLPILACFAGAMLGQEVLAQSPAQTWRAAGAGSTDIGQGIAADALVRRMVAAADARESLAAKVRFKIALAPRPMLGSGLYLQQGRGAERRLRFELQFDVTPRQQFLQVCDGRQLWVVEEHGEEQTLYRLDVMRLALARPVDRAASAVDPLLGLGGLPKLVAGLDQQYSFFAAEEGALGEIPVWIVEGRLEPARLTALLPDQGEAIARGATIDISKLAPNLPDRAVLYVGRDDFMPYRIEYWRGAGQGSGTEKTRTEILLILEFYEVDFQAVIDPNQFVFEPGELTARDRTNEVLKSLGLEEILPAGASGRRAPRR